MLSALIKEGVYPDVRTGLNSFRIPDSSDKFNERHDLAKHSHLPDKRNPWRDAYWFRTEFLLPTTPEGTRVWLHFDAINYRADVWLNGSQIADRILLSMAVRLSLLLTERRLIINWCGAERRRSRLSSRSACRYPAGTK